MKTFLVAFQIGGDATRIFTA